MRRTISMTVGVVALIATMSTVAGGLPYAVSSLEKAKELAQSDSSKHILVFYTEGW